MVMLSIWSIAFFLSVEVLLQHGPVLLGLLVEKHVVSRSVDQVPGAANWQGVEQSSQVLPPSL